MELVYRHTLIGGTGLPDCQKSVSCTSNSSLLYYLPSERLAKACVSLTIHLSRKGSERMVVITVSFGPSVGYTATK